MCPEASEGPQAGLLGPPIRGGGVDPAAVRPPSVCLWAPPGGRSRCLGLWLGPAEPVPVPAHRVQVEFYVNENTFKERLKLFFIKNQRSSEWPAGRRGSLGKGPAMQRAGGGPGGVGGGGHRGMGSAPSGLHSTFHASGSGPGTCGDPAEPRDGHGRQGLSPASSLWAPALPPSPRGTPGPSVRPPFPCRLCPQPCREKLGTLTLLGCRAECRGHARVPAMGVLPSPPPPPKEGAAWAPCSSGGGQPSVQGAERGALG